MRYTFCFLLFASSILSSCKFNPNLQGRGEDFLQGEWQEDSILHKEKLLEYTRHSFKFTCDSFYASLETHSKVNRYADSCFKNGIWKEYAKGTYILKKDTLYLIGTFTKDNFKQKISGCYRVGQYLPVFLVEQKSGNHIQFQNLQNNLPVDLEVKRKFICTPKPL